MKIIIVLTPNPSFYITGVLTESENDTNYIQLSTVLKTYDVSIEPIFNNPLNNITKECT